MALDTKQIANLNALNQRIAGGYKPTGTDLKNLQYASDKGYQYNPLPQGATKITDPNYLKTAGLTEKDIFRSGQDIYKLPVPNQLPVDTLGTGANMDTVPVPEPTPSVDGLMAGVKTGTEGLTNLLEQQQAQLASQTKKDEITKRMEEFGESEKTAGRDLQEEMFSRFGLNQNVEQIQKILPQMASLQAQADRLAEENRNRPISSRIIGGTADRLARQTAVEMAGLGAMAQAYQGNIDMARTLSQDAINAKYADQENYLNNLTSQLNFIENDLSREETTKLEQLELVINERERNIAEAKELETNISNLMISAAQKGASQEELDKIMKAPNYMTAVKLAQPYLKVEEEWIESDVTDANGNPMLFNPSTGEYKNIVGTSASDIFFTDANGDNWNIAGWATDQTKPAQMNVIAKRIGKLTEENLEEKVKEFTPGLTADMIREASAQSGVSWEALMTMVVQESLGGTSNVAKANNNFGGLTFNNQEWIKEFGGEKGTDRPSAEGGNYIKFPTKQAGLNAMANLMAQYGKVTPQEAVNTSAQNWAKLISEGNTDLANVPADQRTDVVNALSTTPSVKDTTDDLVAKQKAQQAISLINHKGLNNAVGTIRLGRYAPFQWGQKQDFIASVEQLVSGLSLEALIEAKSRGATFGALSDREMGILAASATKIGTWTLRDKNGRVTGYKARESDFKAELQNISNILNRGLQDNTINQVGDNTANTTPVIVGQTSSGISYQVIE